MSLRLAYNRNFESNESNTSDSKKIIISNHSGYHFIDPVDIVYLQSDGNCCYIHLQSGKKLFCSRTLKSIHAELNGNMFKRIHNSYVLNWQKVVHISACLSVALLSGGAKVPISRSKRGQLKLLVQ